ncbi:MAG: alpha/beta fold hydrolase [Burkholderiaceae bacterium]
MGAVMDAASDGAAPDEAAARALIERLRERASRRAVLHQGATIVWHCFGEGPPVALLHGGHGSWLHWVRNIEPLAERHSVWVADMPGYGLSDVPAGHDKHNASIGPLVDIVAGSLQALCERQARPLDLVGFSFGGLVAAHVAERLAEAAADGSSDLRGVAVRRLVLLGPAGHGGPRRPRGELVNWRFAAHRRDADALREAMRHNLAVHMLHADASIDPLAIAVHTDSCIATRFRSKEISRAGGLVDLVARRIARGGQTSLIWGEHDVTADPSWVAEHVAPGHVAIVPGAGHWVQYEGADAINARLGELLAR